MRQSTPFFHETDFRNWLDGLKDYSPSEEIHLYHNLRDREEHAVFGNPSCDLQDYVVRNLFQEEYFLEPFEPEEDSKQGKDDEISSDEEKRRIEDVSHLEATLREKFVRGTQRDFETLASQLNPKLTKSETVTLFWRLVDDGSVAMDPDGWWRWTR
jgi:hypothetical protein